MDLRTGQTHDQREFRLIPVSGCVEKFSSMSVDVEFIPVYIRKYDLIIDFGINRFPSSQVQISLTANCVSPMLELDQTVLDFGNIFIGYCYTKHVRIRNSTEFGASYEFTGTTLTQS